MTKQLFVGNLSRDTDASRLIDMFTIVGDVKNASVVRDEVSGESKGFGFVEMSTEEQAADCIAHFNGKAHDGLLLRVCEAHVIAKLQAAAAARARQPKPAKPTRKRA